MNNPFKLRSDFVAAAIVFILAMTVYLMTLAPGITIEDSGELIAAAYTLGIAHPPGFPLYAFLGKFFTFIPFGSIAWRVNLMSAVFGALTVALLYLVIAKLIKRKLIAGATALILAFSPIFWSQSVIAEVYTLNIFFTALLILLLLVWSEKRKNSYLFWFAFLYGLSLTNHTMGVLLAPAFAFYIFLNDKRVITDWKLILKMFLLFILGLAFYFYLPLRAWQKPDFNWGPIDSWGNVLAHITRAQYNDFSPLINKYSKLGIFISFLAEIYQQFFLPTLLLAFFGAVYLWRKNRSFFVLSAGVFLLSSLGVIYLRKFGWGLGVDYTYRVYYLPAFLMVVIWLAAIIDYLYGFLLGVFNKRLVWLGRLIQLAFFLVLISLPVNFLVANYARANQSDFWLAYDYAKNLLASLEPNSVYYFAYDGSLQGDTEIFSLVYLKMVENFRPDVDVVSEQKFFYKDIALGLPLEYYQLNFEERRQKFFGLLAPVNNDRPVYTNFAVFPKDDLPFFSLSNGYAHRFYPGLAAAREAKLAGYFAPLRNLEEVNELSDYPTAGLAAHYYYNLAAFYLVEGDKEKSQSYLIKAFNLDTAPFSHEYSRFIEYRAAWLGKE